MERFHNVNLIGHGAYADIYQAHLCRSTTAQSGVSAQSTVLDFGAFEAPIDLDPPAMCYVRGYEIVTPRAVAPPALSQLLGGPPCAPAPAAPAPYLTHYPEKVALKRMRLALDDSADDYETFANYELAAGAASLARRLSDFAGLEFECPEGESEAGPEDEDNDFSFMASPDLSASTRSPRTHLTFTAIAELHALQILRGRPGVVPLIEYFSHGGDLVLVLPLAVGSLAMPLPALPERIARSVLRPMLEAVAQAHAAGVRHGDIKPSNVLAVVEQRPRVRGETVQFYLSDWGSAAFNRQNTMEIMAKRRKVLENHNAVDEEAESALREYLLGGQVVENGCGLRRGSRCFLSPEILYGCEEGTPAADIWALGLTFIALLTGTGHKGHPWARTGDIQQMAALIEMHGPLDKAWPAISRAPDYGKIHLTHTSTQPPPLSSAPQIQRQLLPGRSLLLCDMIFQMMRPDPAQRPSAEALLRLPWWRGSQATGPRAGAAAGAAAGATSPAAVLAWLNERRRR